VSGHKPGLLPGRCHHPVFPLQQLPAFGEGPLASPSQGGVLFLQGKVQFVDSDQLLFYGDVLWVGPGSSWNVCTVKCRFSSASASILLSGCGPAGLMPFTMQLFLQSRWWIGFDALLHSYARLGVQLVILGFVGPRILQIGSSQSVVSLLSRQGGEFHGAAP
jgi:hypothetical protein